MSDSSTHVWWRQLAICKNQNRSTQTAICYYIVVTHNCNARGRIPELLEWTSTSYHPCCCVLPGMLEEWQRLVCSKVPKGDILSTKNMDFSFSIILFMPSRAHWCSSSRFRKMSSSLLAGCSEKEEEHLLCIDADDEWRKSQRGDGDVGRRWMSNSLTSASTSLAILSAHRMWSFLSALCNWNEVGKAAILSDVTIRRTTDQIVFGSWFS